jgi:hypothetical protein
MSSPGTTAEFNGTEFVLKRATGGSAQASFYRATGSNGHNIAIAAMVALMRLFGPSAISSKHDHMSSMVEFAPFPLSIF